MGGEGQLGEEEGDIPIDDDRSIFFLVRVGDVRVDVAVDGSFVCAREKHSEGRWVKVTIKPDGACSFRSLK